MNIKETKTYRTFMSYLLVLCIVCGLVGSHAPIRTVKAAETASSYTVTLNGKSSSSHFWMYNEKGSDGPITLSYTVKEMSSDNVGRNGVVANQTTSPQKDWPCDYGSAYRTAKDTSTNKHTNHFMKVGCTYTLTIGKDASGAVTFSGSYQDAEGTTYALTPISDWADWSQSGPIGPKNASYQHFGVHFTSSVTGTLTNVTCVDGSGNDLGITSNQTGDYAIKVEKEAEKVTPPSYTVTLNGKSSSSHFWMYNETESNGPITLSYTVKELSADNVGRNGVVANQTTAPYKDWPCDYGSAYRTAKDTSTNKHTNHFMKVGCTYTLTIGKDASGAVTFSGSYQDAEGTTYALTPISDWADWSQSGPIGPKNASYKHFGVHFTSSVTGTLTNVTCVDAEGNDLGITSNQTGDYAIEVEKEAEKVAPPSYTVTLKGKSSSSHFWMYNETESNGPITLSYTVKELSADNVGRNGVVANQITSPQKDWPCDYGSAYRTAKDTSTNKHTNHFMKVGCTYTLTIGKDASGAVTFSGSYQDAEGTTYALTPISDWADWSQSGPIGPKNASYQHFGVHFTSSVTGTLTNVTCVDAEGNDLGITSNQTGDYAIEVKKNEEEVESSGYTITTTGIKGNFFLGNKTPATGTITLTYTVQETNLGATTGNNGVVATHSPTAETPFSDGSMLYHNTANMLMVQGSTYKLELSLDDTTNLIKFKAWKDGERIYNLPHSPNNQVTGGEYFGIYFASKMQTTLTDVTCVDAEGNNLGLISNQSDCVITGGPQGDEPGENPEGGSGEEPGGSGQEPGGSQEDEYDSTNWTKYNVTLGGSASSLFLSNKTATSGAVILRYTVAETSAKDSAGNNGVAASTSPTAPFPYAYGNGSMLFNAPTNNMMKAGCTYTLKLSLDSNGFVTVDGYYIDAAGNKTGNLKAYIPRTAGSNNEACQHFGIYVEKAITATLTNVSCVDENGKDLGLQANQLGCTFENLSGDTGDAVVKEKLPSDYTIITLGNFGIKDGTYRGVHKQGFYALSMHKTVFSVDIEFSTDLGEDLRYGSKVDGWHGLRFWSQENNLYMEDVDGYTDTYVFDMVVANMKLVGEQINLKISTEYVDSDSDGMKDDVKLGIWFNDNLYNNEYIYLKNYKNVLGKYMSVYSAAKAAYITVSSVEGVKTGVDYSIWGYTNNWKKEMGIE